MGIWKDNTDIIQRFKKDLVKRNEKHKEIKISSDVIIVDLSFAIKLQFRGI